MRSDTGFTLIELMIVVVIMGILAAIAIPRFSIASTKAREKEAETLLKQIYTLQEAYRAQVGFYADQVPLLEVVGWSPPTSLQSYTLPTIVAGGGSGASTYSACMFATTPGLNNMSINQQAQYGAC